VITPADGLWVPLPLADGGWIGIILLVVGVIVTLLAKAVEKANQRKGGASTPGDADLFEPVDDDDSADLNDDGVESFQERIRQRQMERDLRRQLLREIEAEIRQRLRARQEVPDRLADELRQVAVTLNRLEAGELEVRVEPEPQPQPLPQPQPGRLAPTPRPVPSPQAQPSRRERMAGPIREAKLAKAEPTIPGDVATGAVGKSEIGSGEGHAGPTVSEKARRLRRLLSKQDSIRTILVAKEVLDPPVALRSP
jgi:hypothetical protein